MEINVKVGTCGFGRANRPEYVEPMELVSLLPKDRLSYVFFNNITMKEDAVRFTQILKEARG